MIKNLKKEWNEQEKEVNYAANTDAVATLFFSQENFTKDNTVDDVIELSDKLYNLKNKPDKSTITIQIGKPTINTKKAFYDDNRPIEYGVHSKDK